MNPLNSIIGTLVAGLILSIAIVVVTMGDHLAGVPANSIIIWAHAFAGIVWIGLLYYFNFVQVPALAEAVGDAEEARRETYMAAASTAQRTRKKGPAGRRAPLKTRPPEPPAAAAGRRWANP